MYKISLFLYFICLTAGHSQNSSWLTSFEAAQKVAVATDKLIIIDFYASWCGPCKKMDSEAFSDPEIAEIMDHFVLLRLDFDGQMKMRTKYNVNSIPYVFVTDSHGEVLNKQSGYNGKERFKNMIEKYALNTEYFQKENIHFLQKRNYVTALRLAQKYMDFSLYVDPAIKRDFLRLSGVYLKHANNLLDTEQENYKIMSEKIFLMELSADLYSPDLKKVKKHLKNIKETEVDPMNLNLYNFLNYGLALGENQEGELDKWEEKLDASDLFITYKEKFKIIFNQ